MSETKIYAEGVRKFASLQPPRTIQQTRKPMKAKPRKWRLFDENGAIHIEILNQGGGDYIQLEGEVGSVSFNPEEWDDLRAAIDHAILHIKPEKQ